MSTKTCQYGGNAVHSLHLNQLQNDSIPETSLNESYLPGPSSFLIHQENANIRQNSSKTMSNAGLIVQYDGTQLNQISRVISLDQTDNNTTAKATLEPAPIAINRRATDFLNLSERLKTFDNWTSTAVTKNSLAEAGFIYTGTDDVVLCPFCQVEGLRWEQGDNPMEDHRSWNRNCTFVRGNVGHDGTSILDRDTCGTHGIDILQNSIPEDFNFERLGVQKSKGPHRIERSSYESRLETFENWPKSLKQKPAELAEAGLYYLGVGDHTVCFYCNGGLKNWAESDVPWEQHAIWYPKCAYLNLKQGPEFVNKFKSGEASQSSPPETSEAAETKESAAAATPPADVKNDKEVEPQETRLCKICYKNELGVVFLPCGHIIACVDCAAALKTCAVCRKPLEAAVRAFLS